MSKINIIIVVCAIFIVVSFFLPWISVESKQASFLTKIITGRSQQSRTAVSGFQVPIMANSNESRLIITIARIFAPEIKDADKKSFLIWGTPLFAVAISSLLICFRNNKIVNLSIGLLSVGIFLFSTYKIKTIDSDKVILQIKILPGLWTILCCYLGPGLIGISKFINMLKVSDDR